MTINTASATAGQRPFEIDPSLPGISFGGVLRSELSKLKALRTTWWLSLIAIGLGTFIAGSVAVSYRSFGGSGDELALAEQGTAGAYFAMILLGSLGAIAMTTEYSTGAIRSSLTAVPRRTTLLIAKAFALTLWSAGVTLVMMLLGHLAVVLFSGELSLTAPFQDTEILSMYGATGLVVVLTTLMGFGLGVFLRSSAGAIVVLTLILFVVQMVLAIMYGVTEGAEWVESLLQIEYMALLDSFVSADAGAYGMVEPLERWQGLLGILIWVAVPNILGWLSFSRRDA